VAALTGVRFARPKRTSKVGTGLFVKARSGHFMSCDGEQDSADSPGGHGTWRDRSCRPPASIATSDVLRMLCLVVTARLAGSGR
jgi:hypothetical protein